jgi:hypothetical protein
MRHAAVRRTTEYGLRVFGNRVLRRAFGPKRVFGNRVLRRAFGPKRDEVPGEWWKLHSEELHGFTHSQVSLGRSSRG